MTVTAKNTPVNVDVGIGLRVNLRVEEMDLAVYPVNTLFLYENLVEAFNGTNSGGFSKQNWVNYAIYDSGLFQVFNVFDVPREDIDSIKALIEYDGNPSRANLIIFLQVIFKGVPFEIIEGNGIITINVLGVTEQVNNVLIGGEEPDLVEIGGDSPNLKNTIQSENFVYTTENLYLLQNYIGAGIKCIINYSS